MELVPVLAVCASQKRKMPTSNVHNKRICKDGPVFLSYGGGNLMKMNVNHRRSRIGRIRLRVASGTFGSGAEYTEFVDLNKLGASHDKRCS